LFVLQYWPLVRLSACRLAGLRGLAGPRSVTKALAGIAGRASASLKWRAHASHLISVRLQNPILPPRSQTGTGLRRWTTSARRQRGEFFSDASRYLNGIFWRVCRAWSSWCTAATCFQLDYVMPAQSSTVLRAEWFDPLSTDARRRCTPVVLRRQLRVSWIRRGYY
jgi:hypothetical protein